MLFVRQSKRDVAGRRSSAGVIEVIVLPNRALRRRDDEADGQTRRRYFRREADDIMLNTGELSMVRCSSWQSCHTISMATILLGERYF